MTYAINFYNNSINNISKLTPFEIINGHTPTTSNLSSKYNNITISDYLNNHTKITTDLYKEIHKKSLQSNEQKITKVNQNREDAINFNKQEYCFIRNDKRISKDKPLYTKKVIKDQDYNKNPKNPKILTPDGYCCKNKLKRPRKIKPINQFQRRCISPSNSPSSSFSIFFNQFKCFEYQRMNHPILHFKLGNAKISYSHHTFIHYFNYSELKVQLIIYYNILEIETKIDLIKNYLTNNKYLDKYKFSRFTTYLQQNH